MLELEAVTIQRSGRVLIDAVNLKILPGCFSIVLGPNGAGKSTLMKALSGEWHTQSGRVLFDGHDIRRMPAAELARRRAIVPQNTSLAFPFTALEVVQLGMTVPGFGMETNDPVPRAALAEMGLYGFVNRNYMQLSGGERQRVHIARALCQLRAANPPSGVTTALILDEPTSNLDPAHQMTVLEALHTQARAGHAVIVVLHDLNQAARFSHRLIALRQGEIFAAGPPAAVMTATMLREVFQVEGIVDRDPHTATPVFTPLQSVRSPNGHGDNNNKKPPTE